MIVEDENGNDIDLNDLRDQEREPDEPTEPAPLDLDWIESVYTESDGTLDANACQVMAGVVPDLIVELRGYRDAEETWAELPTRTEWTMTASSDEQPGPATRWYSSAEEAEHQHDESGQMWCRTLTIGGAVPISSEAPF